MSVISRVELETSSTPESVESSSDDIRETLRFQLTGHQFNCPLSPNINRAYCWPLAGYEIDRRSFMLPDTFAYNINATTDQTFDRVIPTGNAQAEFLLRGSSRAEPQTLQISRNKQGSASKPVLRIQRSWRTVKVDSVQGPMALTYSTSVYLPLYTSVFTDSHVFDLHKLDIALCTESFTNATGGVTLDANVAAMLIGAI